MQRAPASGLSVAELNWGRSPQLIGWVGRRPVYQFWPVLAPYFRDLLLQPYRRSDQDQVSWQWRDPAAGKALSAHELSALRGRLQAQWQWFIDGSSAGGSDGSGDAGNAHANSETIAELRRTMGNWVEAVCHKSDPEFATFACRTGQGLRLHSWGAWRAAAVKSQGLAEIRGSVRLGDAPVARCEVRIEKAGEGADWRVKTDAMGEFCQQGLENGRYLVTPQTRQGRIPPQEVAINLATKSVYRVDFSGERPASGSAGAGWWSRVGGGWIAGVVGVVALAASGVWLYRSVGSADDPAEPGSAGGDSDSYVGRADPGAVADGSAEQLESGADQRPAAPEGHGNLGGTVPAPGFGQADHPAKAERPDGLVGQSSEGGDAPPSETASSHGVEEVDAGGRQGTFEEVLRPVSSAPLLAAADPRGESAMGSTLPPGAEGGPGSPAALPITARGNPVPAPLAGQGAVGARPASPQAGADLPAGAARQPFTATTITTTRDAAPGEHAVIRGGGTSTSSAATQLARTGRAAASTARESTPAREASSPRAREPRAAPPVQPDPAGGPVPLSLATAPDEQFPQVKTTITLIPLRWVLPRDEIIATLPTRGPGLQSPAPSPVKETALVRRLRIGREVNDPGTNAAVPQAHLWFAADPADASASPAGAADIAADPIAVEPIGDWLVIQVELAEGIRPGDVRIKVDPPEAGSRVVSDVSMPVGGGFVRHLRLPWPVAGGILRYSISRPGRVWAMMGQAEIRKQPR